MEDKGDILSGIDAIVRREKTAAHHFGSRTVPARQKRIELRDIAGGSDETA